MRKEEFYFDSRDGENRIYAVRFLPDTEAVKGIVQLVHGVAEHIGRYEEFAQFLTDKGFVVTGEDHLGHGKSVKPDGLKGYFCELDPATVVVRDVHRLKKITQEAYPGVPYFIFGHSMGSFMVRNYICYYGKGIDGAIISSTANYDRNAVNVGKAIVAIQKKRKGSKYVSKTLNSWIFGNHNKPFEPARTPFDWFTKDAERIDTYMADPLCGFHFTLNGMETLMDLILGMSDREGMTKIPKNLPILVLAGDKDPLGGNGKAAQEVYDRLKELEISQVELKLYENDRHELLNETDREVVMQDISAWLERMM